MHHLYFGELSLLLFQMPLHGLRLDIDDAILKRKTKDIIRYLHERLKKVISTKRFA